MSGPRVRAGDTVLQRNKVLVTALCFKSGLGATRFLRELWQISIWKRSKFFTASLRIQGRGGEGTSFLLLWGRRGCKLAGVGPDCGPTVFSTVVFAGGRNSSVAPKGGCLYGPCWRQRNVCRGRGRGRNVCVWRLIWILFMCCGLFQIIFTYTFNSANMTCAFLKIALCKFHKNPPQTLWGRWS